VIRSCSNPAHPQINILLTANIPVRTRPERHEISGCGNFSMKIEELLENILKGSRYLGTFPLVELLPFTGTRGINGIAVAKDGVRELYIALLDGEPEGAIYTDDKGVLFGDKAALMITGRESFVLTEIKPDVIEALIMSSRLFNKNRLKKGIAHMVPEIRRSGGGIGILSVTVLKDGAPANGIRVSIRQEGRIVGSDITTSNGNVGFRIAYGEYDCILQDRTQVVMKYRITFDETHPVTKLNL
jgi:hypothetical protein